MNIIILHGDDIVRSRARLEKFIDTANARGWEVEKIDKESKLGLTENLASQSLFGKEKLFVIEGVSSLGKSDFTWLGKKEKGLKSTLVIFNEGLLGQTILKLLPKNVKTEEFKIPVIIFDFLNSFFPGNSRNALKLFHEVIENEPAEFVFALLAKHLRDVYLAKISPDVLTYAPWRVGRLKSQSSKFSQEFLERLISHFAQIDIESKTGGTPLVDSLDLTIATQLQ